VSRDPIVSVVMPTYNAESFIRVAIDSVRKQTYTDFELIVIDDGSKDRTGEIAESIPDSRIRVIRSGKNAGLAAARNAGLEAARGKYVSWLDSDDFAHPKRIAYQVHVLEKHHDVGLCGTWVRTFGQGSQTIWRYPRRSEYVRAHMLFADPLATSSVTLRRGALNGLSSWFNESCAPAEDYELWERISRTWKVVNVPLILTSYRLHADQTSTRDADQTPKAIKVIQGGLLERLGVIPTPDEWKCHLSVGVGWGREITPAFEDQAIGWLSKLNRANSELGIYPERVFKSVVSLKKNMIQLKSRPSLTRRCVYLGRSLVQ
jgi:glycosyltransferase involved in cell wall biosynthesis